MKQTAFGWCCFCLMQAAWGQTPSSITITDRVRIYEAAHIARQLGDRIWEGYSNTPFSMILVTDSTEFLIYHPKPSPDFQRVGNDSLLQTEVYNRKRIFPQKILATFPAVNGINCIVTGTAENTQKNSAAWMVILLHEHFHQLQYSRPDYYPSVERLDLAKGDNTGGWMLNYAFPYDSAPVVEKYKAYVKSLIRLVENLSSPTFGESFTAYSQARQTFKATLKPEDYRYFSFQLWQEGIARYTEYKFVELLRDYKPSPQVAALADFKGFAAYKEEFYRQQMEELHNFQLPVEKRVCFYAIGFAEGLVLDKINPGWKKRYFSDKFFLEEYMNK